MLTLHTHYHAIGRHEVLDGISLFEELWVRCHIELYVDATLLQLVFDGLPDLLGRSHRNSRLRDDHHIFLQILTNGLCHLKHILQIGTSVLIRRRTYSREHNLHIIQNGGEIGGELQTTSCHILPDKLVESWFIYGNIAVFQTLDLLCIHIYTSNVSTRISKTRT